MVPPSPRPRACPDAGPLPPARIAISGASGMVGRALTADLVAAGSEVVPLVRNGRTPGVRWDPEGGWIDAEGLDGVDAVVHLAGENLVGGLWTAARRQRIRQSRSRGTRLLASALAGLRRPPDVFLSASAVGIYGHRGDELLTEEAAPGRGFLSEVCSIWESSTQPAVDAGIRTVRMRIGLVLSSEGGLLGRIVPPFRLGLGGRLGRGDQWMSWITISDLVRCVRRLLVAPELEGAVNLVGPTPVRNEEFTTTLGAVLSRPTPFPIPAVLLRLLLRDLADEALLVSTRVVPARMRAAGFLWHHQTLEDALRAVLCRGADPSADTPSSIIHP